MQLGIAQDEIVAKRCVSPNFRGFLQHNHLFACEFSGPDSGNQSGAAASDNQDVAIADNRGMGRRRRLIHVNDDAAGAHFSAYAATNALFWVYLILHSNKADGMLWAFVVAVMTGGAMARDLVSHANVQLPLCNHAIGGY
jgi:hypothetical protein